MTESGKYRENSRLDCVTWEDMYTIVGLLLKCVEGDVEEVVDLILILWFKIEFASILRARLNRLRLPT